MSKASIELHGLEPNQLADQISSMWVSWNSQRQVWLSRVKEVLQYIYATSTRETTNVKNPWSHSTHIPKLTQIHDNLGANYYDALFSPREFFEFVPGSQKEATIAKSKAIKAYLDTKHDYSGFYDTMLMLLQDWSQTGNCFGRLAYVKETAFDSLTNSDIVVYEGPKLFRISPYDITFDPTIAHFKDSPKIIRTMLTKGELFRKFLDEQPEDQEAPEYDLAEVERAQKFYTTVSGMKEADVNKQIQMQMDGFGSSYQYFTGNRCELLEFVGDIYDSVSGELHKNQIITILDRRFLIRKKQLSDYQGFGNIYHCGWRERPDNLWAMGPLDNLVGMQYLIDHLENARADAFDQMISPDRQISGQVEIEQDGPVTNYYFDDTQGRVVNLGPDTTILNADNQIQYKEAQMEAYAGAPREAMGIRSPGEKTKFEVAQLINAAGRMFQVKIELFERKMIEPILNGELELSVRNMDTYDIARTIDDDLQFTTFIEITKDDLTSRGKLRARGASVYAKQSKLVQELQAFENILATDRDMKVHFPPKARAKLWADTLDFDKYKLFEPFGSITEAVEAHEHQVAAQQMMSQTQAASDQSEQTEIDNAGQHTSLPAEQQDNAPTPGQ